MKKFAMLIAVVVMSVFVATGAAAQFRSSVARVFVEEKETRGHGFFVTRNLIMTSKHLISKQYNKETKVYSDFVQQVIVRHGGIAIRAKVVDVHPVYDMALLEVKGKGPRPFRFCKRIDTEGEEATMWVYRFGKFGKFTGEVVDDWGHFLLTTITPIDGNSGSPLIQGNIFRKCVAGMTESTMVKSKQGVFVGAMVMREFLEVYLSSKKEVK